jgi:hypothetical protein
LRRIAPWSRLLVVAGLALIMLTTSGCIRSRMRITSSPTRADVFVNDVHYGRTPVEVPFTWYWHYKIELRKEGYEPVARIERLRTPVYFLIPFDLIMEMMPFPITDTKKLDYELYRLDNP